MRLPIDVTYIRECMYPHRRLCDMDAFRATTQLTAPMAPKWTAGPGSAWDHSASPSLTDALPIRNLHMQACVFILVSQ
jgi:hypothetical protein